MHSTNDNIRITTGNEVDQVIKETLELLLFGYQKGLEKSVKGSNFVFHCVDLLYYKCYKINFDRGETDTHSSNWIKSKSKKKKKKQ